MGRAVRELSRQACDPRPRARVRQLLFHQWVLGPRRNARTCPRSSARRDHHRRSRDDAGYVAAPPVAVCRRRAESRVGAPLMKVAVVGGGPAGLYFALLMKKADPGHQVVVLERNAPDDTFGWGVVFSDPTLGNFAAADEPSFRAITEHFARWDDIDIHV